MATTGTEIMSQNVADSLVSKRIFIKKKFIKKNILNYYLTNNTNASIHTYMYWKVNAKIIYLYTNKYITA